MLLEIFGQVFISLLLILKAVTIIVSVGTSKPDAGNCYRDF